MSTENIIIKGNCRGKFECSSYMRDSKLKEAYIENLDFSDICNNNTIILLHITVNTSVSGNKYAVFRDKWNLLDFNSRITLIDKYTQGLFDIDKFITEGIV